MNLPPPPGDRDETIRRFHTHYYNDLLRIFSRQGAGEGPIPYWMGAPTLKCPLDMWIYQEILFEVKPEFVIETGTRFGGSALFLAHMLDLMGKGHVLTVDIEKCDWRPGWELPPHKRITYLRGSSTSDAIVSQIRDTIGGRGPVLAILDSDHHAQHVLNELRLYAPMITPGSYLIVEDTNVNGHPVFPTFGAGPMEAVQAYLRENPKFVSDRSREKFMMTLNPTGYLRRMA